LKLSRRFLVTTLCALTCVLLCPLPAAAQDGFAGLCSLFSHQQQIELEELELAVQLDETRLVVAEEIFVLLDSLYQNDLVGHLPYLGAKHRYDAAELNVQQAQARRRRQLAVARQYQLACSATEEQDQGTDGSRTLDEARQRYVDADCELRVIDVELFEIDLEYYQELLASAADLRQSDIASRQQVLFAEEDVQVTLEQLQLARQRAGRCGQ